MIEKWKLNSKLFIIGSVGYSILEIVWRGFTHWTMSLTGGVCFTAIYYLNGRYREKPLFKRGLMGSAVITGAEFVVGCVVNKLLHWNIWDYSRLHFNILGQVCLLYSALWFLLSMPLCLFSEKLRTRFQATGSGARLRHTQGALRVTGQQSKTTLQGGSPP